jgi:uncharacterized membrane protein
MFISPRVFIGGTIALALLVAGVFVFLLTQKKEEVLPPVVIEPVATSTRTVLGSSVQGRTI